MALEVMEKHAVSTERRARHLYALGDLCASVSFERAITYLEKAISLFTEAGDLEQAAQAHVRLGQVFSTTNFGKRGDANTMSIDRAFQHYRAAEKILSGGPGKESLVSLYAGLAIASWEALRIRDAIAFSRHAVELAESLGLPQAWFRAAFCQCFSLTANSRIAEAKTIIEKMEEKAAVHDTFAQFHLAFAKSRHYMYGVGDPMAAAEWQRRLAEWKGLPDTLKTRERQHLAVSLAILGHLQEAREIRAKYGLPKIMDAIVARLEGRWLDSESLLDGALEEEQDTGSRWDIATVFLDRGRLNRTMGQFEAAEAALLESLQMTAGEQVQYEFDARTELALVYADTGRPTLAEPHLSRCREIVAVEDFFSRAGLLARAEGVLAASSGRIGEADQLLAKSLQIFEKYHRPLDVAETYILWGQAALAAGESSRAQEHFDAAVEIYRSLGAGQAWIDRVERQRTRALAASHESLASIFRKEGDATEGARAKSSGIDQEAIFRREGEFWTISYRGNVFRLKDTKGLGYIAHLLRQPGTEFHSMDLTTGATINEPGEEPQGTDESIAALRARDDDRLAEVNMHRGLPDHAGEMLDPQAKAAYRQRRVELTEELEDAREIGNSERAAQLEDEIDALNAELSRAVGLGGRHRRAGSISERARLSVTRAIKAAIERITENDGELGALLVKTIKTGTFCSYAPDARRPVSWEL